MRHLDLFSGIGGFALAASSVWGNEYENVGHSEVEPFSCEIYHKHFKESRCLGDITKIEWKKGQADIITGGFPCQPHSLAGKRKASKDSRDLWAECKRAVSMVLPRWALFENVPGLLTSEKGEFFRRILRDLAEIGYDAEWHRLGAHQVGAPHKRDRIWIVAYPSGEKFNGLPTDWINKILVNTINSEYRGRGKKIREKESVSGINREALGSGMFSRASEMADTNSTGNGASRSRTNEFWETKGERNGNTAQSQFSRYSNEMADTTRMRCGGRSNESNDERSRGMVQGEQTRSSMGSEAEGCDWKFDTEHITEGWWTIEPNLGMLADGLSVGLDMAYRDEYIRVATGIPKRAIQLKALGNSIVPMCATVFLQAMKDNT